MLFRSSRFGSPLLADQEGESDLDKGSPKLALDSVFRTAFPSRFKRDALCVSIAAPGAPGSGTVLRLLNVHLDSLDSQFRRALEMRILAGLLREPGCSGGVVAGDFNAIDPLDETLVDKHALVDAWVALRGTAAGGATWGVGVEREFDDVDGRRPGRLDKVVMLGVQPCAIDVLQPGLVGAYTRWSDHCGLRCTFAI